MHVDAAGNSSSSLKCETVSCEKFVGDGRQCGMPRPITQGRETTADVRLGGTRPAARSPYTVGRSTLRCRAAVTQAVAAGDLELRAVLLMQRELCEGERSSKCYLHTGCRMSVVLRSFCIRESACLCCVEGTCGEMGPLVGV